MANTPRHPNQPEARASSAREQQTDRMKRAADRPDPVEVQKTNAEAAHKADPEKNPAPQVGMSSSQLNTATPAEKEKATKEAEKKA